MIKKTTKWQLQEAKNKFSEVVRLAEEEGPQTVTRHGKDTVVILSAEEYDRMQRPAESLIDFFRKSPLTDAELEIERDTSPAREIRF